jgi:hypothetical protein
MQPKDNHKFQEAIRQQAMEESLRLIVMPILYIKLIKLMFEVVFKTMGGLWESLNWKNQHKQIKALCKSKKILVITQVS